MKQYIITNGVKKDGIINVTLKWKYQTLTNWVDYARGKIDLSKEIHLQGHSVGAIVALILASEIKGRLTLYSPSPIIKETLKLLTNKDLQYLGKRRRLDINQYSLKEMCKDLKIPVDICVGELEVPFMHNVAKRVHKLIPHSKLHIIKGADHLSLLSPRS